MDTNHTPGPWQTFEDGIIDQAGDRICTMAQAESNPKQAFADMRLIAAAPDMLKLLQDFEVTMMTSRNRLIVNFCNKARAMILAARGTL
jgi:hypothetical protein